MARIRTIKPEFWTHEDLSNLPEATHMLAAALLNHADDEGYFNANPGLIRAACCPLREPSVSIPDSLTYLSKIGFIRLGRGSDGKRYGLIVTFEYHQRVNRPTPSKIKGLGIAWDDTVRTHGVVSEDSPPERNREQGTGKGKEVSESPDGDSSEAPSSQRTVVVHPQDRICQIVLDAYHVALPNCARIQVLAPKRRKRILAANKLASQVCKQEGWTLTAREFWESYFEECAADAWMRGDVPNPKNPRWKQNLFTLIDEDRFAGIMDQAVAAMRAERAAGEVA